MTTKTNAAKPGDTLTLLASLTLPTGGLEAAVYHRGYVFQVTPELLEMTKDRAGNSFLDDLSDEAQTARWDEVKIARGDQSAEILWWNAPGDSASRGLARTIAGERAREISDPAERRAAIAAADSLYGPKMTSHTIGVYAPDAPEKYGPGK